jgi:hypothetical protein
VECPNGGDWSDALANAGPPHGRPSIPCRSVQSASHTANLVIRMASFLRMLRCSRREKLRSSNYMHDVLRGVALSQCWKEESQIFRRRLFAQVSSGGSAFRPKYWKRTAQ